MRVLFVGMIALSTLACSTKNWELRNASKELNCPKASLVQSPIEGGVKTISGCGRERVYLDRDGNGEYWIAISELLERASFDLSCDEKELQPKSLSGNQEFTVGVSGCGQKATYVYAQTGQYSGGWVMDSASKTSNSDGEISSEVPETIP